MIEEFIRLTEDLVYRPKSIFPSEMFLFYREAKQRNVDQIIETGAGFGGSSSYLARLFPNVTLTCIDDNGYGFLTTLRKELPINFIQGDATQVLLPVIERSHSKSIAVLIDGPKGKKAIDLANKISDHAVLIAIHDIPNSESQADEFRTQFGFLDHKTGLWLKKYPKGPGLSLFKC